MTASAASIFPETGELNCFETANRTVYGRGGQLFYLGPH